MKYTLQTGIILRSFDSGASDKIIHILNNQGFRTPILVKGAKKTQSKKNQHIEIGNLVNVKTVDGYAIPIMSDITVVDNFSAWKIDYQAFTSLSCLLELTALFVVEEQQDLAAYELLRDSLELQKNLACILAGFILKMLELSGTLPRLDHCIETGKILSPGNVTRNQGITGYIDKIGTISVPDRLYKIQKYILSHEISQLPAISVTQAEALNLLQIHLDWAEAVSERTIKSTKLVLSSIKKTL